MDKTILIILILSFADCLLGGEYPYEQPERGHRNNGPVIEIGPTTPFKAQDGIGLCYGFSATSLLEHFRCKELGKDCTDPNDFISSLDVTSYYQRKSLVEGGDTYRLLSNVSSSDRKLAREECVKFSALLHQMNDYKNRPVRDEKRGWIFLTKKWNEYKGIGTPNRVRQDCVTCLADDIKKTLANVTTPADQIKDAFLTSSSLEEFLYKAILPSQCLDPAKTLSVPPFVVKTFPAYRETLNRSTLTDKITDLLEAKIPVEMSICTLKDAEGRCARSSENNFNAHSIALFGIKEVCSPMTGNCKKVVLVKNSYGASWQQQNNDGWIDLNSLVESSLLLDQNKNITWIEKPGFVMPPRRAGRSPVVVAPPQINRPASNNTVPNEYKNYQGIWRCPGNKFVDHFEAGCSPMSGR